MMAANGAPRLAVIMVAAALLGAFAWTDARASDETVDRATQTALALDAHPKRGALQFSRHCARCHGTEGEGDPGRAIPALAGQRFAYLVRQLADFAGEERDSNTMHKIVTQQGLQEPQAWVDIAAYLNRVPSTHRAQNGDGREVGLGRRIFQEQCASCHRDDAHGDDEGFVPSLRNQHYAYLVKQLHQLSQGHRHNVDPDLVNFLRAFSDLEMSATADYISRLRGRGAVRRIMRNDGVVVD